MPQSYWPGRGETEGESIRNCTSYIHDDENQVGIEFTFHGEGRGEWWFTVTMTPDKGLRGVTQMSTEPSRHSLENVTDLVLDALREKRKVFFECVYPTKKRQTQKGQASVEEVVHRVRNAAAMIQMLHPLYNKFRDQLSRIPDE
ncbi:hypothetical protein KW797_02260 [Candidatus Parcubacteria bacterium]|nr:hypothetical protein [Candidatus Parcubacteria bacterium]